MTTTQAKTSLLKYSHTIGICVMDGRGFMFPVDTAIGRDGRMHTVSRAYVPATAQLRITMYDIDGEYFGIYGGYGEELGEFRWPTGMAADSDGNVYVSDEQNNRINIFTHEGEPIKHWGEFGNREGQLNGPSGIAFDKEQNLFVADHLNNRIQKFTKDGEFIMSFGDVGEETLKMPWGICVGHDNSVYVADWANDRILKYDSSGSYVNGFGTSGSGNGQFKNPSGVAVDTDGYIYVTDWGNERLVILDESGNFVETLRGQATISKWADEYFDGNYEEAEPRSRSNLEPDPAQFGGDPHEESAHIEKYFWGPTSVKIDECGRIYVTESNRHRVQIYERTR
ncbi:MAG: NHL repeat-containing protein [Chloroflexota bacterium]|nr:NHL repeat-containing protein [Chloroflexota bacterium]